MYLNTNISAMQAIQSLNNTSSAENQTLDQLSTGDAITSAASNPAGLAISELMQSQTNGLNQASQNAQDGTSLLQTADGAMNNIDTILQSMYSLASQAATGTNNTNDLGDLQTEMNSYASEITDISNTTQFNNINLLDGGFQNQAIQIGANQGQALGIGIGSMDAASLNVTGTTAASVGANDAGINVSSLSLGAGLSTGSNYSVQLTSATGAAVSTISDVLAGTALTAIAAAASNVTFEAAAAGTAAATYTISVLSNTTAGSNTYHISGPDGFSTSVTLSDTTTSISFDDTTNNVTVTVKPTSGSSMAAALDAPGSVITLTTSAATTADTPYTSATVTAETPLTTPLATPSTDVTGTFGGSNSVTYNISVTTGKNEAGTDTYAYAITGSDGFSESTAATTTALTAVGISDGTADASLTFSNTTALDTAGTVTFSMTPATATYQLMGGAGASATSISGATSVTVTGSAEMQGTLNVGNTSSGQTANGQLVSFTMASTMSAALTSLGGASVSTGSTQFTVAQNGTSAMLVPGSLSLATTDYATANSGVNISTQASAQVALTTISSALQKVDTQRASVGAAMNSLSFAQSNAQTESTNLSSANAGYMDANMPADTSQFMQQSTLIQADVGLLAQAEQLPANLLKLIP